MRTDFANRSARKPGKASGKKSPNRTKNGRRADKTPPRRFFHGPSFSGGLLFGAALVLVGAYLPDLIPKLMATSQTAQVTAATKPDGAGTRAADASSETSGLRFEFHSMLRDNKVKADPGAYEPAANPDAVAQEYLLQAASFRSQSEADTLRAELLLMSLPAVTDIVALSCGRWYRVTVGPFKTRTEAERAMTKLRGRNISPLWINRNAA